MALNPDSLKSMIKLMPIALGEFDADNITVAKKALTDEHIDVEGLVYVIAAAKLLEGGLTVQQVERLLAKSNGINLKG